MALMTTSPFVEQFFFINRCYISTSTTIGYKTQLQKKEVWKVETNNIKRSWIDVAFANMFDIHKKCGGTLTNCIILTWNKYLHQTNHYHLSKEYHRKKYK
jgi:hypothetical protein